MSNSNIQSVMMPNSLFDIEKMHRKAIREMNREAKKNIFKKVATAGKKKFIVLLRKVRSLS